MNQVLAIVVTYNRKELLREALEALTGQPCDVLVVDNASTDGTHDYIVDILQNSKMSYCNTGKNIGGAGGFNYGMKWGVAHAYEYLWLMDDDCIVKEDTLQELLKADKKLNGQYGFLSCVALWTDGNVCTMNIQKDRVISKIQYPQDVAQIPELIPVVMASFVAFFVKVSTVKEMGYPISDFFIWSDDLEYSRRISMKYTSYVVGHSKVLHKMKANQGNSLANDDERFERYRYAYRNDYYVFSREGLGLKLYYYVRLSYHIFKILIQSKKNKWKKIKLVISATKEGRKFHPTIEYPSTDNE